MAVSSPLSQHGHHHPPPPPPPPPGHPTQGKKIGEVAYLKHNTDYIFYLITKKRFSDKKICPNVLSCLVNLSALCSSLGIKQESMPRLGCGLDLLKYEDVLPLIHAAFYDCSVEVTIVTPPPTFNGMSVFGDSQGLRLLLNLNRGKLPAGFKTKPFPRSAGFYVSELTVLTELLNTVDVVPNNSLGDALLFSGTNDLLALAAMESRDA
ncbi:hypothetical protein FOCC_FOCC013690 [Frankliniella occidentalis]|nr:hypothetical protein FOCC_FOCC013690 [Frankliniella occidentalis]